MALKVGLKIGTKLDVGFLKSYVNISSVAVWLDNNPLENRSCPYLPTDDFVQVIDGYWRKKLSVYAVETIDQRAIRVNFEQPVYIHFCLGNFTKEAGLFPKFKLLTILIASNGYGEE
mmetsp:Transcript_10159/g.13865  ORF Transcript_10159/g.13865 Transcript_10159/m.13865 type:complete len:117 (+) Transcript_10159:513-863(+)